MNTFKKGDRVKVVNMPDHVRNGMEATVAPILGIEDNQTSYFVHFDDTVSLWINKSHLELITAAPRNDEYADMSADEQVAVLTEELYEMSRLYQMDKKYIKNLQHDLETYDDVMRETKEDQGWCDEGTNKVINTLNDRFICHSIEPYQQEFEIEYEITAGVTTRGSVMIMASSEDAAREFFDDDPEAFITPDEEAKDEVRSLGWDNIEVESI